MYVCSVLVFAFIVNLQSLTASDWKEFRGAGGLGQSDHALPTNWSETENIRWKVPIAGLGWSSPVVSDGQIFLTTAVPGERGAVSGHSLRLLCLDARSAAVNWDVEAFWQPADDSVEIHSKNSHASPTPVIEGDRVYVHFGPHGTACFRLDGTVVWATHELAYLPVHGNGGSPAISGDLLIINCDGRDVQYVAALDKQTGELRWRTNRDTNPTKGFSFCTPAVIRAGGESQVICAGSSAVFAYVPETGQEIWRLDYGEGYSVVPRPLYANGLIYVCSGFGDAQLFAIDPTGHGNITDSHVKWSTKKAVPKSSTPIIVGDELFMVSDAGVAVCMNAVTGEVHWQDRLQGKYSASPITADGLIYFQNERGLTTVIQAAREFREVARNQIGTEDERTFATLAVVDDAILLRTETHLYRIQDSR
jgi:outer membrane protein assembly factor BamB